MAVNIGLSDNCLIGVERLGFAYSLKGLDKPRPCLSDGVSRDSRAHNGPAPFLVTVVWQKFNPNFSDRNYYFLDR